MLVVGPPRVRPLYLQIEHLFVQIGFIKKVGLEGGGLLWENMCVYKNADVFLSKHLLSRTQYLDHI